MFKRIKNQSGAALLTVLVALMIISLMLFEFQYNTMVERQLAFNELNHVQAYYLAKSGVRIGLLRLALYGRAKRAPGLKKIPNIDQYLKTIWEMPLPPFPPEAETVKTLDSKDKNAAEQALKETKIEEGQFSQTISPEGAKININYLQIPESQRGTPINFVDPRQKNLVVYVGRMLINFMERLIQESDDAFAEYGNLKPEEVVYDIMDWVNPGGERTLGGDKDSYYLGLNPPYRAKRNRFYTVDELKLVRGINDKLFTKLKPYITTYSEEGKIDVNAVRAEGLRAIGPTLNDDDIKQIMEERDNRQGWSSPKEFVDYVADELGRREFRDEYDDENNYPFTVNSQSFVIESTGVIRKSASEILKQIRVAVALTSNDTPTPNNLDQAACRQQNDKFFWFRSENKCYSKPRSESVCKNKFSGQWTEERNQFCCNRIIGMPAAEEKQCIAKSSNPADQVEATGMKILYWSET